MIGYFFMTINFVCSFVQTNVRQGKRPLAAIPHASKMRRHGQIKRCALGDRNPKIGTIAGARTPWFDDASDNAFNTLIV